MSEEHKENGGLSSLQDALRTTFLFVRVVMFVLVIAFIFSGVESIDKNEKAVVLQFGKLKHTVDNNASFVFAWPYPFDSVVKIKTSSSRIINSKTFMPEASATSNIIQTTPNTSLIPGKDGYLITADMNFLHCDSTLRYTIVDLPKYLFDNEDLDLLIKQLLDKAVVQTVAQRDLADARKQKEITQATLSVLNSRITDLQLGIEIQSLELKTSFPAQIKQETLALSQASSEASKVLSDAELYARKTKNEADSTAANIVAQADIDTTDLRARSEALLKTFLDLKGLYDKAPELTKEILLREKVASMMNELEAVYMIDPEQTDLRLGMPRRPLQKKGELKK